MGLIWPGAGCASITFPQWRSVYFLPLRKRIPRETRKSPACHPPLRCGRKRCGLIALGLLIATEAAMGAARAQTRRVDMATIGTFTKSDNGFGGQIKTVTLNVKAKFAPAEKENDKAPDYRIFAGQTELVVDAGLEAVLRLCRNMIPRRDEDVPVGVGGRIVGRRQGERRLEGRIHESVIGVQVPGSRLVGDARLQSPGAASCRH
jgi:hypothetical protein